MQAWPAAPLFKAHCGGRRERSQAPRRPQPLVVAVASCGLQRALCGLLTRLCTAHMIQDPSCFFCSPQITGVSLLIRGSSGPLPGRMNCPLSLVPLVPSSGSQVPQCHFCKD